MQKLTVENFSVIKNTKDFVFGNVTVLIGPQSSGKSVLSRLAFFGVESINIAIKALSDLATYSEFQAMVKEDFQSYFPVSTWGAKPFEIVYRQGEFQISISRRSSQKQISNKLNLSFSKTFKDAYEHALFSLSPSNEESSSRRSQILLPSIRLRRTLESVLGDDASATQTFIPAGRSFFTSVGKAIVAFEESGALDPLTIRFGRQIRWDNPQVLPQIRMRVHPIRKVQDMSSALERESASLLGGSVKFERDKPFFAAKDGRKMPLSWLSSGQQELLPLLATLRQRCFFSDPQTLYIEEPEAHIFPEAQRQLVSLLARISYHPQMRTSMVLTTHSPYFLSAFNNLIYAGKLADEKPELKDEIAKIIPAHSWVANGSFRAYCIHDGELGSILSESGLIDGEYLDSVSNTIGSEFDELLRLEYGTQKAS
jgi:ABC-type polar amino acid transport system ATPase subunit